MPKSFRVYDTASGRVVSTISRVADAQRLAAVAVTNASPTATTTTTASLWPGMLLIGKGIPVGTTVLSVDSTTEFTMSGNATAAGTDLTVIALAFIPYTSAGVIAEKEVHLEHYRDIWSDVTPLFVTDAEGLTVGVLDAPGVTVYPDDPDFAVADSASATTKATVTGTATLTLSDDRKHEPPREQVQICSFVHFILDDGTLVPVLRLPSYDIVPTS